jgi:hypothetical protein
MVLSTFHSMRPGKGHHQGGSTTNLLERLYIKCETYRQQMRMALLTLLLKLGLHIQRASLKMSSIKQL